MSPQSLKLHFLTVGCAKNEVDTAHMIEKVRAAGFEIVDEPQEAHGIIVNTCSFIQAATEESLEIIFDMADLDSVQQGDAKIIVTGCLPSRYGDDLEDSLTESRVFIPCDKEDDIVDILVDTFAISLNQPVSPISYQAPLSAYVKISDGCDRFCTYCTIPYIRGRYHSYPQSDICEEVEKLVQAGTKEIVLIAQDTGRWGTDFEVPSNLACLMSTLAQKYPETWFRVMYIQPEGISEELLDTISLNENICSYLDIPLQHVNSDILKMMNRTGSRSEFSHLIEWIRNKIPDITLRTTLIAGFPGENEDSFEELCDFVESSPFDYVGVFAYSQEEGTKAAIMENQVSDEDKNDRAQRLRDCADEVCSRRIANRIGRDYDVLVLGHEEDGQLYGRAQCQAPDVDGVVYLPQGKPGDIITVTISDTLLYEMEGE